MIYILVACPGAGKTWVTSQLGDLYHLVHHDLFIGMAGDVYVKEILKAVKTATRPILAECPFSMSAIIDPLKAAGIMVVPVFIQEDPAVIAERYFKREKKPIPKGHLTRQETYAQRARAQRAFMGTSSEVLEHLKKQVLP